MPHTSPTIVIAALLASALSVRAQDPPKPAAVQPAAAATRKTERKPVYDEGADAKAQIATALVKAKKDHKRVLIQYGANWCGWCVKLHDTFHKEKEIAKQLFNEYEVVLVDVWEGADKDTRNQDIVAKYGAEISGIPFLTVLDEDGKVLVNQPSDPLEEGGDHHSVAKVTEFLTKWQVPTVDGEQALAAALATAKQEDKLVFLHFGAPWCGWCHKLEDFMARKDIAAVLALDFVDIKIDEDRMTHAKEIEKRFGKPEQSGIPWLAFLDSAGATKATSTMANGKNTGYPSEPTEVAHFVDMLQHSCKRITAERIKFLEAELNADRERRDAAQKAAKDKAAKEAAEKKS
ncbi:MAG TPA: DUF255 domain-containing protein [Planctomycetota bacterium]|nr:DUF255 domain-containing protein [Planctomycetota bacterium]